MSATAGYTYDGIATRGFCVNAPHGVCRSRERRFSAWEKKGADDGNAHA